MIRLFKNIITVFYVKLVSLIFSNNCKSNQKNILFINTEQIGDIVISSAILEYDNYFQGYDNVYLLIRKEYMDLLRNYDGKVKIIYFESNKFKYSIFYNYGFVKLIKKLNIGVVYNISPARGQINEIITQITGASLKHSTVRNSIYLGDYFIRYWNKKYSSILFNDILNEYSKTQKLLELFFPYKSGLKLNVFLSNSSIYLNQSSYVTISPFSSIMIKDWDVRKFINLITRLETKTKIYIICSPSQKYRAIKYFGFLENVIITDINLSFVSDLIFNSCLFIGNDSGLTHLAVKLGVKTIAIIGGGTYGRFFPIPDSVQKVEYKFNKMDCFGCNWNCIYDSPKCMDIDFNVNVNRNE